MIILSSGTRVLLEVISVRAINLIYQSIKSNQANEFQEVWNGNGRSEASKRMNFKKCGMAMASNGNINRLRNLIIRSFSSKCKRL